MLTLRLEKGSALTHQEADDNNKFPFVWAAAGLYSQDMIVFDGSDFYYKCIQDVITPNLIPLSDVLFWKKLNTSSVSSLNDISDVNLTSPQVGQSLRFDGVNWVNDDSLAIIDISYNQLIQKRSNSEIIPGTYYRMEYQNSHTIVGTSDVHVGPVERLLLLGVTDSEVSKQAFSESYSQDLIYFNPDNNLTIAPNVVSRTGYIERRVEVQKNISYPYDFRNTVSRRFKQDNPFWAPTTAYTKNSVVKNGTSLYGCVKDHTSDVSFANDTNIYWHKLIDIQVNTWGEYVVPSSFPYLPGYNLGGFTILHDSLDYNDFPSLDVASCSDIMIESNLQQETGDILIGQNVDGVSVASSCLGVTISDFCLDNEIGYSSSAVYLDHASSGSEIKQGSQIFIGANCLGSKIERNSNSISISDSSRNNTISNCIVASISNNSNDNNISTSDNVRIGSQNVDNEISSVSELLFFKDCSLNEVSLCLGVEVGFDSKRNFIIDSDTVVVGSESNYNEISASNTVSLGSNSDSNILFDSDGATVGNSCKTNKVLSSSSAVLEDFCEGNELNQGSGSQINTGGIGNSIYFSSGIILPNNSRDCKFIDTGAIIFTDLLSLVTGVTVESGSGSISFGSGANNISIESNSGQITIEDNCSNISFFASGQVSIGDSCSNLVIKNSGQFGLGAGCSSIEIIDCANLAIGNAVVSGKIEQAEYIVLEDNVQNFEVKNTSASPSGINVRTGSSGVYLDGTGDLTVEANCSSVRMYNSTDALIGANSSNISLENSDDITVGAGCYNINFKLSNNDISVPAGSNDVSFENCSLIGFSGTPVMSKCKFLFFVNSTTNSNLTEVVVAARLENKTIQFPLNKVSFLINSNTAVVITSTIDDLVFNSKSPDGQIWAIVTDNFGNITNKSLV